MFLIQLMKVSQLKVRIILFLLTSMSSLILSELCLNALITNYPMVFFSDLCAKNYKLDKNR